jgi:hypothetical protein
VEIPEGFIYRIKFDKNAVGREERKGKVKRLLQADTRSLKGLASLSKEKKGITFLVWWELLSTQKEINAILKQQKEDRKKEKDKNNKEKKASQQNTTNESPKQPKQSKTGRTIIPKKKYTKE